MGDFNSNILSKSDKHNGDPITSYDVSDFRECCYDLDLVDLNYSGVHFTWSNGKIWTKIDRVMVNHLWCNVHMTTNVHFSSPGAFSNLSPVSVLIGTRHPSGKRPFKFNIWSDHPGFLDLIIANWNPALYGTPIYILCKRLKFLKSPFKQLNQLHYSHISQRVVRAEADLKQHQTL